MLPACNGSDPVKRALAVIDWGIGGLPTLMRLRAELPTATIAYLSDAGFTPYGKVPQDRLHARLLQAVRWARSRGFAELAVACNALSSVLHQPAALIEDCRVYSLPHSYLAARLDRPDASAAGRTVGIFGGDATIARGLYRDHLAELGYRVVQASGQALSARIEAGDYREIDELIGRLLAPLRACDQLVLACTHYPAVSDRIAQLLPNVEIVDPSIAFVARIAKDSASDTDRTAPEDDRLYTTGDRHASAVGAAQAFGYRGLDFIQLGANFEPQDL